LNNVSICLPKSHVPPTTTPDYLQSCQALCAGDYEFAKAFAEMKFAD